LVSIAANLRSTQLANDNWEVSIEGSNAFRKGDGVTWRVAAEGISVAVATEAACCRGLGLLLLMSPFNVRLLDKDWSFGSARDICLQAWRLSPLGQAAGSPTEPSQGTSFYGVGAQAARATPTTGRLSNFPHVPQGGSSTRRGRSTYQPPTAGAEPEREQQIYDLLKAVLKKQQELGRPAIPSELAGGRNHFGPMLNDLLRPGTLRRWLDDHPAFETKDVPGRNAWSIHWAPGWGTTSDQPLAVSPQCQ